MNYITKNIECFLEHWCELQDNVLVLRIDGLSDVQEALNQYKEEIHAHDIDVEAGTLSIDFRRGDLLAMYLERKAEHDVEFEYGSRRLAV